MDWSKIFINWEAPLFWSLIGALVGLAGGYFTGRHFYRKTGRDLEKIRNEIFDKIDKSNLSPDSKAFLKAQTAASFQGVFNTYPWESEYDKEIAGEANTNIIVTQQNSSRKRGSEGEDDSPMEF